MSNSSIEAQGAEKRRGRVHAVRGVSFSVGPGEIVALLGPNGAGKTTLFSMLAGLLTPDAGRILVSGRDPARDAGARRALGFVPQAPALYPELSVEENARFFAALRGTPRREIADEVERIIAIAELGHKRAARVADLSGGMQRRLNFSVALLGHPKVLLLDEPTVGVDPATRAHLHGEVRRAAAAGAAVLWATHQLEEAERTATRLLVMHGGLVVREGSAEDVLRETSEKTLEGLLLALSPKEAT